MSPRIELDGSSSRGSSSPGSSSPGSSSPGSSSHDPGPSSHDPGPSSHDRTDPSACWTSASDKSRTGQSAADCPVSRDNLNPVTGSGTAVPPTRHAVSRRWPIHRRSPHDLGRGHSRRHRVRPLRRVSSARDRSQLPQGPGVEHLARHVRQEEARAEAVRAGEVRPRKRRPRGQGTQGRSEARHPSARGELRGGPRAVMHAARLPSLARPKRNRDEPDEVDGVLRQGVFVERCRGLLPHRQRRLSARGVPGLAPRVPARVRPR
jgi:hypothetical protein